MAQLELSDPIIVRWVFKPERASEFLDTVQYKTRNADGVEELAPFQPTICEVEYTEITDVWEELQQFQNALIDANAIVNKRAINLIDFRSEAPTGEQEDA